LSDTALNDVSLGAQVRISAGSREKPASSIQTIVRSSRSAFFDQRPGFLAPVINGSIIALAGTLDWLLDAPANSTQQATGMVVVVGDPKFSANQLSNPLLVPDVAKETVGFGAALEPLADGSLGDAQSKGNLFTFPALFVEFPGS
jgi:hypothetical protein